LKDLSEWDVFTTRDSVMLEDLSISNFSNNMSLNLSNISMESKNKIITRRNALGSRTTRDFDTSMGDVIIEI
jgi:predicted membrane protein